MASYQDEDRSFDSLVWLLIPEYNPITEKYSPSKFILEYITPQLSLPEDKVIPYRGDFFDFRLVNEVYKYFDYINDLTVRFANTLVVIPFESEDLIVRDVYMSRLTKLCTSWSTCYVDCPDRSIVTSSTFNYIVERKDRTQGLLKIIHRS